MKTIELFEKKAPKPETPDWARNEDAAFNAILKRFGLRSRKRPTFYKDRWVIGGELVDVEKRELSIPLEKRVAGLQKAVAKHLFDHHQAGREVAVFQPERYGYKNSMGTVLWSVTDHLPRLIYKDDSLAQVENLVKDRLYINNKSGGGYTIVFQFAVSEPKKEEPKPVEKKVYRVVKAAK